MRYVLVGLWDFASSVFALALLGAAEDCCELLEAASAEALACAATSEVFILLRKTSTNASWSLETMSSWSQLLNAASMRLDRRNFLAQALGFRTKDLRSNRCIAPGRSRSLRQRRKSAKSWQPEERRRGSSQFWQCPCEARCPPSQCLKCRLWIGHTRTTNHQATMLGTDEQL